MTHGVLDTDCHLPSRVFVTQWVTRGTIWVTSHKYGVHGRENGRAALELCTETDTVWVNLQ